MVSNVYGMVLNITCLWTENGVPQLTHLWGLSELFSGALVKSHPAPPKATSADEKPEETEQDDIYVRLFEDDDEEEDGELEKELNGLNGEFENGELENGELENGELENGELQNGELENGELQIVEFNEEQERELDKQEVANQ